MPLSCRLRHESDTKGHTIKMYNNMRNSSKAKSFLSAFLMLSAASAAVCGTQRPAFAGAPTSIVVSTPQIQVALDPYTADGHQRVYQLTSGGTYWTNGLPIYQGDKIHVAVFVSTGADDLQLMKIRLDNRPVADLTAAPWSAEFDSSTLGAGPHVLEAWAQVSGPKPQFVSRTLSFFVQQDINPPQPTPAAIPVTASTSSLSDSPGVTVKVKGGVYTLGSATQSPDADVRIIPQTITHTNIPVVQGQSIPVTGPVLIQVVPAVNSQAIKFTYAITRYGNNVVPPTQVLQIGDYTVRLQPKTASTSGLLDGPATLEVWGIDAQGNHSAPQLLTLNIQPQSGS